MRFQELKLRAWFCFGGGVMVDDWLQALLDGSAKGYLKIYDGGDGPVITQFSGLLDCNGLEIWAGDIVSVDGSTTLVEFFDSSFRVRMKRLLSEGTSYVSLHVLNVEKIEVLGNIFQNEKLLEQ